MNKSKNKTTLFSALFVILVCGIGSASAAVLTFSFTGVVTFVGGTPFGSSPSIGQQVQGSFTYDTSLPPAFDTGSVAGYIQPPPSGMSVVISGVTLKSQGDASLQVLNNAFGVDNLNGFFTPISVGGVLQSNSSSIGFSLTDFSQTALSSTALPRSLNAASFGQRQGSVFDAASGGILNFSIDSLAAGFAGTPGFSNCPGQSVAALALQYGGLDAAAKALGFPSAKALQDAIRAFCRV
jgi:hypothetical protein